MAVQIHGCFWHGHDCPRGDRLPGTNTEFWRAKIKRTRQRDRRATRELTKASWRVVTIWECETDTADADLLEILDEEVSAKDGHCGLISSQ